MLYLTVHLRLLIRLLFLYRKLRGTLSRSKLVAFTKYLYDTLIRSDPGYDDLEEWEGALHL